MAWLILPAEGSEEGVTKMAETSGTLLSAVTSTGTGTALALDSLMSKHIVTVTWGGTVPTSATVALEGSIDGTNYVTITTFTMTSSPWGRAQVDAPMKYLRGNYISKSGGDSTTAITMISSSGGN